jgi:hypothetical protein
MTRGTVAANATVSEALEVSRAAEAQRTARREERVGVVRHVEYTPFPRVSAHQRGRLAFTRDASPSGLCLRVEAPERAGALLRVAVHGVDGRPARVAIARVVWTSEAVDGAHWVGLQIVEECARRILRVRRPASPLALAGRRRGA